MALSTWSTAASARISETATPIGTENSSSGAGTSVPGGPAGKDEVAGIEKVAREDQHGHGLGGMEQPQCQAPETQVGEPR